VLGAVGALALVTLLVAGFAYLLGRTAKPSPLAPLALSWHPVSLPPDVGLGFFHSFALAPSDGNVAYTCVTPYDVNGRPVPGIAGGATQVWATHDRGAHWTRVADLPAPRADVSGCAITVDDLQSARALAFVAWSRPALDVDQTATYTTSDGGRTWQPLADPDSVETAQLATRGDTVFALRCCLPVATPHYGLFVSHDQMRTWRLIDGSVTSTGQVVLAFWVQPETGDLLVPGWDPSHDRQYLWISHDQGAHWAELPSPASSYFLVRWPALGRSFSICGVHNTAIGAGTSQVTSPDHLFCSADSGRTWEQRSVLTAPVSGPRVAAGALPSRGIFLYAITSGGDVLMADTRSGAEVLYRLVPSRVQWQSLGVVPGGAAVAIYVPAASGPGVLWGLPLLGANSGTIVDPRGRVFTTDYPDDP
jgi:hypothetical protein